MSQRASVVICGAGFAGVSTAYFLAVRERQEDIVLIDELPALSLTSDHSTECYRNWWPDRNMASLMNRSIELLEELAQASGNAFHLNKRGYLYCSADAERIESLVRDAQRISRFGAGQLRIYESSTSKRTYQPHSAEGFQACPDGADLLLDPQLIQTNFPYLSQDMRAALHVRKAGWLSAQQLGRVLLEHARCRGVRLLNGKVREVDISGDSIRGVFLDDGTRINTPCFINAAGPYAGEIAQLIGVDLPFQHELHLKLAFNDPRCILDRSAPLVILNDPQVLDWSADEMEFLIEDQGKKELTKPLPSGLHIRPEGGATSSMVLALWEYHPRIQPPIFPIVEDPLYPEVVIRGLVKMIPGMKPYTRRLPRPRLDGGYYTRTPENLPLICPLPVQGAFLIGALSGFGLMACCASGELLAAHVTGGTLPQYAPAFHLNRYQNQEYLRSIESRGISGQL